MGYTSTQHQIRIEGVVSSPVFGERDRIGQVLTNLLSNTVKYSPHASAIRVTVAADANTATIGVQDFGIGIAPEKHEHVFERFFRVSHPESKTFPGLGLGLFISAQIVRRHGGRMWVESQEGEGSTFFFTIRCACSQPPTTQEEEGGKDHP